MMPPWLDRSGARPGTPLFLAACGLLLLSPLSGLSCTSAAAQITVPSPTNRTAGELGLRWRNIGPLTSGEGGGLMSIRPARVTGVVPCSPAHIAGVEPNDILLSVNGRDGRLGNLFPVFFPGTRYALRIRRTVEDDAGQDAEIEIDVALAIGPHRPDPPDPVLVAPVGSPAERGCEPS